MKTKQNEIKQLVQVMKSGLKQCMDFGRKEKAKRTSMIICDEKFADNTAYISERKRNHLPTKRIQKSRKKYFFGEKCPDSNAWTLKRKDKPNKIIYLFFNEVSWQTSMGVGRKNK